MLALGDALALVVSQMRNFTAEDFARFHPGGSLGRKLAKVEDVMRPVGNRAAWLATIKACGRCSSPKAGPAGEPARS